MFTSQVNIDFHDPPSAYHSASAYKRLDKRMTKQLLRMTTSSGNGDFFTSLRRVLKPVTEPQVVQGQSSAKSRAKIQSYPEDLGWL